MLTKNLPSKNKFNILLLRLLTDFVIAIYYLFSLRLLNIISILRAHIAFYISFKRLTVKETEVNKKYDYYKCRSILYEYFIRGHSYFSHLKQKN